MANSPGLAKKRGKARTLAMQALYQWQMTGDEVTGIELQFIEENAASSTDMDYFSELLHGVHTSTADIDPLLEKYMDRVILSVDPVERAILRLAAYEFLKRLDVPYRVVLNEAITLTKKFCAEKSYTFINAVLDKVAHETRSQEITHS